MKGRVFKNLTATVLAAVMIMGTLTGCSTNSVGGNSAGATVAGTDTETMKADTEKSTETGNDTNDTQTQGRDDTKDIGKTGGDPLILTVNPNYEGAYVYTISREKGMPILLQDVESGVQTPGQKGFTFTGWFYDKEGTKAVDMEDVMENDTTIYAAWEVWDEATAQYMDMVLTEAGYAREICNCPTAYTKETFDQYQALAAPILFLTMGGGVFPKEMEGLVYGLADARSKLQLAPGVDDPEDTKWYIWGDQVAQAPEAPEYDYYGTWDNAGFKPFLVPCMLEDQSQVKGNIILISGGGFQQRANRWEAYPAIEVFNDLGYNCFVLQRRVAPSSSTDSGLDLQRAIRYLKYHAGDYGIAKIENLAAAGYSGGGLTISIAVSSFYGDILSTVVYPDYVCDEIDQVNSDLASMILIYSAAPLETENPNIPDAFVVIGVDDPLLYNESYEAMKYYKDNGIRYEAHFFSDAAHGFGEGFGLNSVTYTDENVENVKVWPQLADTFLSIQYGYMDNIQTIQ